MNGDESFGARARALREEHGIGLFEAVRIIRKERLLKDLDAATSVEDLKPIIRKLINHA